MKKVSFFGNEMVSGSSDKSLNNLIEGQSGKIWVAIFNVYSTGYHKNILTYNDNNIMKNHKPWEFACFYNHLCLLVIPCSTNDSRPLQKWKKKNFTL